LEIIYQFFLDGLFPKFCLSCGREKTWFCQDCLALYKPVPCFSSCFFCEKKDTLGETCEKCQKHVFLDGCLSFGFYGDPILRKTLQKWKYHGQRSFEVFLNRWIQTSSLIPQLLPVDWFLQPIPLHRKKEYERGFNQAKVIAQMISNRTNFPIAHVLTRNIWTNAQAGRKGSVRCLGELDDIFALKVKSIPSHILLCDDVFTSGATMDAAAKVLKEAGAEMVWGIVLAKG